MADDRPEEVAAHLRPEDRRRLAHEARRAVRRLAEALEEAGEDPSAATDAATLLKRLQAAVQPLAVTGTAGIASRAAFGRGGSVNIQGQVATGSQTAAQGHIRISAPLAPTHASAPAPVVGTLAGTLPSPSGMLTGHVTWTGAAGGAAPDSGQITANEVPQLLAEIADTLLDIWEQQSGLSNQEIVAWATYVQTWLSMLLQVLLR